jgi:hypothetical protein
LPFGQVVHLVAEGTIVDAMTVIAVLHAERDRGQASGRSYSPWQ